MIWLFCYSFVYVKGKINSFLIFATLGTIGSLYYLILALPSDVYLNWHIRFSRIRKQLLWQKLASLAKEVGTLWFQFFVQALLPKDTLLRTYLLHWRMLMLTLSIPVLLLILLNMNFMCIRGFVSVGEC